MRVTFLLSMDHLYVRPMAVESYIQMGERKWNDHRAWLIERRLAGVRPPREASALPGMIRTSTLSATDSIDSASLADPARVFLSPSRALARSLALALSFSYAHSVFLPFSLFPFPRVLFLVLALSLSRPVSFSLFFSLLLSRTLAPFPFISLILSFLESHSPSLLVREHAKPRLQSRPRPWLHPCRARGLAVARLHTPEAHAPAFSSANVQHTHTHSATAARCASVCWARALTESAACRRSPAPAPTGNAGAVPHGRRGWREDQPQVLPRLKRANTALLGSRGRLLRVPTPQELPAPFA